MLYILLFILLFCLLSESPSWAFQLHFGGNFCCYGHCYISCTRTVSRFDKWLKQPLSNIIVNNHWLTKWTISLFFVRHSFGTLLYQLQPRAALVNRYDCMLRVNFSSFARLISNICHIHTNTYIDLGLCHTKGLV